jgi:hypothetical protein
MEIYQPEKSSGEIQDRSLRPPRATLNSPELLLFHQVAVEGRDGRSKC